MRTLSTGFRRGFATLLATVLMGGLMAPWASALNVTPNQTYNYSWKLTTGGGTWAGTHGMVKMAFELWDNTTHYLEMQQGIGRNETKEGTVSSNWFQPWEIKSMGINMASSNGIEYTSFSTWMEGDQGPLGYNWSGNSSGIGVDDYKTNWYAKNTAGFARTISDLGNYETQFGGTRYLTEETNQAVTFAWDKTITDQYGTYDPTIYGSSKPTLQVEATGTSLTGGSNMTEENLFPTMVPNEGGYSYAVDEGALYQGMKDQGIYQLDITTTLTFPGGYTADHCLTHTATKSYIRPQFALGETTIWGAVDTNNTGSDVRYFNQANTRVTAEVPVVAMGHYDSGAVAVGLEAHYQDHLDQVRLYYAMGTASRRSDYDYRDYVTADSVTSGGGRVYFHFALPQGVPGDHTGLELSLTDATAWWDGQSYTYYNKANHSDGAIRTADQYNDYFSQYVSNRQVDTQGPHVEILEESDFDTYQKTQSFQLSVSETPYKDGDPDTFSFYLTDGSDSVPMVTNVNAHKTPYSTTYTYNVGASGREGIFELNIQTDDSAGNASLQSSPVKLDGLAPRTTLTRTNTTPRQGRYATYTFHIDEMSGNGRVNYCFVEDAVGLNHPENTDITQGDPEIYSIAGEWMFLQQNADTTSAVFGVEEGQTFHGTLYYYTTDDAGNDSRNQSPSGAGVMVDGLYYNTMNANLDGVRANATLEVTSSYLPQPDYDIHFDNITQGAQVVYCWAQGLSQTGSMIYDDTQDVGSAQQILTNGQSITLDGPWILAYTIRRLMDDNTWDVKSFTEPFTFDNSAPTVSLTHNKDGISDTQDVSYYITDRSMVESLSYWLVDEDGDSIPGDDKVTTLTMNAVNPKGTLTIAPKLSGAYRLAMEVTDIYGNTTLRCSQFFSVRVQAPLVEATLLKTPQDQASTHLVTKDSDFTVKLQVTEPLVNAPYFEENQTIRYQASKDDTANFNLYPQWQRLNYQPQGDGFAQGTTPCTLSLNENADALEGTCYAQNVGPVTSGDNTFYLAVATVGAYEEDSQIALSRYTPISNLSLTMDTVAPNLIIDLDHTVRSLTRTTGSLVVSDRLDANPVVTCEDENITLSDPKPTGYGSIRYDFAATANGSYTFTATDWASNQTQMSTLITTIVDTQPRVGDVSVTPVDRAFTGDRLDCEVNGSVYDILADSVAFLVVPADVEVTEENFKDLATEPWSAVAQQMECRLEDITSYYTSTANYQFIVRANETDTYQMWVYGKDDLGQVLCDKFGHEMELEGASLEVPGEVTFSANTAVSAVMATVPLNIPAYILSAQELEGLDETWIAQTLRWGNPDQMSYSFVVTQSDLGAPMDFYAMDHLGNITEFEITLDESDITFTGEGESALSKGIASELWWQSDYIWDEESGEGVEIPAQQVPQDEVPSVYGAGSRRLMWVVEADDSTQDVVPLIQADSPADPITTTYPTQFFTLPSATTNATGQGTQVNPMNGENVLVGNLWGEGEDCPHRMTTMYIDLSANDGVTNLYACFLSHTLKAGADPTDLTNYETATEYLSISFDDVTGPAVTSLVSTKAPTTQPVQVIFTLVDEEARGQGNNAIARATGVESVILGVERHSDYGRTEETIHTADAITISEGDTLDVGKLYYNQDRETLQLTYVTQENANITMVGTSTLGLASMGGDGTDGGFVIVENIGTATFEEGTDYTVTYTAPDGTDLDPVGYYSSVTATVHLRGDGLRITNNGGATAVTLDANRPTFTFDLTDNYGNLGTCQVSHDKFDTTVPAISYQLSTTEKTKEAITATLTVTDGESGVVKVLVGEDRLTETVDDTYQYIITQGGTYTITAVDASGNTVTTAMVVNNLDKTAPVAEVKFNSDTTVNTTKNVVAKLNYSKPDVTIIGVQVADSGSSTRYRWSTAENTVRFYENASVTVSFMDSYGNVGTKDITVTNIVEEPPILKPVLVNTNGIGGDLNGVCFVAEESNTADLDQLTILYKGIARPVYALENDRNKVEVDGKYYTCYIFTKSGDYAFAIYDRAGNAQYLTAHVIVDTVTPVITKISWSYGTTAGERIPGDEIGYRVFQGAEYPATKEDVTVTVTTDVDTTFIGGTGESGTTHDMVYDGNGLFQFNLQKPNGLYDAYAVGIYLIDKVAPTITARDGQPLEDLVFYANPNSGSAFTAAALYDYKATDEVPDYDEVDLTHRVVITVKDGAGEDTTVDAMAHLAPTDYSKDKPYYVTYSVTDGVGNVAQYTRTVTFVGLRDCVTLVNGRFPDSGNRIILDTDAVNISVMNGGDGYVRYAVGSYTVGEMKQKTAGVTVLTSDDRQNFHVSGLAKGWYTFYIQTTSADYFTIRVYVNH